MSILQIGAGGVGWAVAHKLAQNNDVFGDLVLASRNVSKCTRIIERIKRKSNIKQSGHSVTARRVDADDPASLRDLMRTVRPKLVVNVGPPWINVAVMAACADVGVSYLDTSVATDLC